MGLLNASMFGALPALLNQQGGGQQQDQFLSAFQNNPQFMQQLQAMQNGQGPGRQAPTFTPPPMQMSTSVPMGGGQRNAVNPMELGLRGLGMMRGSAF